MNTDAIIIDARTILCARPDLGPCWDSAVAMASAGSAAEAPADPSWVRVGLRAESAVLCKGLRRHRRRRTLRINPQS